MAIVYFDSSNDVQEIKEAIMSFDLPLTVNRLDGSTTKTWCIHDDSSESGMSPNGAPVLFIKTTKTLILPGDLKKAPEIGDRVTLKKNQYVIVKVNLVAPNLKPILYEIEVQ